MTTSHDHDHAHDHEPAPKRKFTLSEDQSESLQNFFRACFSARGLRYGAFGLIALLCGSVIASVSFFPPKSEVVTEPKNIADSRWLTTPLPDLSKSYEQLMLFLDNDDPTRGGPGLIMIELHREAYRLRALAFSYINTPGGVCYQKPASVCYQAFEQNAKAIWDRDPSPANRLSALMELKAIYLAQYGNLMPVPPDNSAMFPLMVDKFAQDRATATANNLNGVAEQQLKTQQEMQNGTAAPDGGK